MKTSLEQLPSFLAEIQRFGVEGLGFIGFSHIRYEEPCKDEDEADGWC